MRHPFALSLCAVTSLGASISTTDFYPIIEYWRAGDFRANQLCEPFEGEGEWVKANERAIDYDFRPSQGLRQLSKQLVQKYDEEIRGQSQKDMDYVAKQRRKQSTWPAVLDAAIRGSISNEMTNPGAGNFRNHLCSVFDSSVAANSFCYAMGNFSKTTSCLSNYEYETETPVLRDLSPSNGFGYTEPTENCFRLSSGLFGLDFKIQQFAVTPDELDRTSGLAEEKVYFAAYKALEKLERYAEYKFLSAVDQIKYPEAASNTDKKASAPQDRSMLTVDMFKDTEIFEEILPNWKVVRVFNINEPRFLGKSTLRTPYAVLAAKGNDLLLVLRKAITTYESRLALYNQQSFKYLFNFTGEVHDGSATIFQTLSGVTELAIESFYRQNPNALTQRPTLTVVGSYLPSSGAALLLASHLERVMGDRYGQGVVFVNAVTFGTPTMSDRTFVDKIRRTIEVRSVMVQGDSTDMFPCPQTFSCDERVLLPRTGIETGTEYQYTPLPGRYIINLQALGRFNPIWSRPDTVLQLAAIKDCGYGCYLAGTHCPADPYAQKCDPNRCESFVGTF